MRVLQNGGLLAFLLVGIFSSCFAFADGYTCFAKANAERGFNFAFEISVEPASVGGRIVLKAGNQQKVLGIVSETGTLDGSDPSQKPAFDLTLGLIGEEDVSGVSTADLDLVKTLEVFRAEIEGGDEVFVYKLFDESKQIGGTILISGRGTSCLPN